MNSPNPRPEWACSQWTKDEHDWYYCPECMEAYDLMIEKAQEDWEEAHAEVHAEAESN